MHLLLIRHITGEAAVLAMPVAGVVALLKGDKAERWGAGVFIGSTVLAEYCLSLCRHLGLDEGHATLYCDMVSTFLLSSYFLYLAVRYGSLWLAAAMVVLGTDFYFNQTYLDADQPTYLINAIERNLVTFLTVSLLASAAIWSWCARIRKRKDDAKREEAASRRQEAWSHQYETLLAGRLAEVAAPAPIRNGRAHLTIEPQLP